MKYSKIRKKRIEKEMPVPVISQKIGISKSYFYQIENGNKCPSIKVMKKVCKILDADPKELFFSEERENE